MKSSSQTKTIHRRSFVQGTLAASAMAVIPSAKSYGQIRGANERVRMAVIGFKGRGRALIGAIKASSHASLVALCDVDRNVLNGYEKGSKEFFRTTHLDEILERQDIDAIASATPNHWHTLVTMRACQAGKHVYIEKPISHNMHESRQLVKCARQHDSIVQCGFQNRSDTGLTTFFGNLREGKYGDVLAVHGTCHRSRATIGKLDSPLTIPEPIDYNLWLGPATDQPVMRPKLHYDWHWDFNTGNGDVGNQGPHEWDMMNWALGDPMELPSSMVAAGNRFGWNDAGNTPNVMACSGVSNGIPFCFEVMDLKGGRKAPEGRGVGVIIDTTKGQFVGGRGGGRFQLANGNTETFGRDKTQKGQDGLHFHMANFVEAVQSRDRTRLRSECAVAANSSAMAHMANISYQLGSKASAEQLESTFGGNVRQRDMLARLRESVFMFAMGDNGADAGEPWLLGPRLTYEHVSARFVDTQADSANQKMTRDYRSGFELPVV